MEIKRPIGRNNLDKTLHRLFPDDVDYVDARVVALQFVKRAKSVLK